jgi:hypothetical protein
LRIRRPTPRPISTPTSEIGKQGACKRRPNRSPPGWAGVVLPTTVRSSALVAVVARVARRTLGEVGRPQRPVHVKAVGGDHLCSLLHRAVYELGSLPAQGVPQVAGDLRGVVQPEFPRVWVFGFSRLSKASPLFPTGFILSYFRDERSGPTPGNDWAVRFPG